MNTFNKSLIRKSLTYEKTIAKDKWIKLQELIRESGVNIKIDRNDEMFLTVDYKVDIELYPLNNDYNGEFVHVQLWYYKFEAERLNQIHLETSHNFSGIPAAFEYINRIYWDVNIDKRLKE